MTAEKLAEEIRQPLKQNGYKKNRLTWYKSDGRVTVVFSVQKSQYGSDLWYYNFGVGLNELEGRTINTISKCCIIERLDMKANGITISSDVLVKAVFKFESEYGDMDKLRIRAMEGRLPRFAARQAVSYLTSIGN